MERKSLPTERSSLTHKFSVAGHDGYITVGLYEDKTPGEIFIKVSKEGSTMSGLMDTIGILTSLALQHGISIKTLSKQLIDMRFEPSGLTENDSIKEAKSIVDYLFRWLKLKFDKEE